MLGPLTVGCGFNQLSLEMSKCPRLHSWNTSSYSFFFDYDFDRHLTGNRTQIAVIYKVDEHVLISNAFINSFTPSDSSVEARENIDFHEPTVVQG